MKHFHNTLPFHLMKSDFSFVLSTKKDNAEM